jgi:hypothetical protein
MFARAVPRALMLRSRSRLRLPITHLRRCSRQPSRARSLWYARWYVHTLPETRPLAFSNFPGAPPASTQQTTDAT